MLYYKYLTCTLLIVSYFYRELGHLKSFVRNKAQPEGSIAEGYLTEESLTFLFSVRGRISRDKVQ